MMKLSSSARQFTAHMSKKEFKSACRLFTDDIMPGHAYDPYICHQSMQVMRGSCLAKMLAMYMAPFKTVSVADLQSMLGVGSDECLEMVKLECLRQREWLIDEKDGVLVRTSQLYHPRDVFERLVDSLHEANLGVLMTVGQKEAWMDAGAIGDKGSRPIR